MQSKVQPIKTITVETGSGGAMSRADEQSTMRVRKDLLDKLGVIAALETAQSGEKVTVLSVGERIIANYIERYESALGRPLTTKSNKKLPLV